METVKLSTIIKFVNPGLEDFLTSHELNIPVVLRDGINSVTNDDILEIIEASILYKGKGTLLH